MPEGPELHLASRYINTVCAGLLFSGKVEKSAVSKNPEVPFESCTYVISATPRGKEVKLTLMPVKEEEESLQLAEESSPAGQDPDSPPQPMDVVFRFGMSGSFKLVPEAELPKHAHLRFYTRESPRRILCFVDFRRFGRWEVQGTWQPDRGPCVMLEYEKFRENVLKNLSDKAFDKPICEALLNQKFFNGIGNYLRAEILYRLRIPPFEKARTVLEALQHREQDPALTLSKKVKLKRENPDLLELCHSLPMEVFHLGGKGYDPESSDDFTAFQQWLRCYYVAGMKSLRDSNGRTIWFQGEPGPMAPKGKKSHKKHARGKADLDAPSSKETKPPSKRSSKDSSSHEEPQGTKKHSRKKELIQGAENSPANGPRKRHARLRQKGSTCQDSPETKAPAEGKTRSRRRAAAYKSTEVAAAGSRQRQARTDRPVTTAIPLSSL
ncbi:PREDICTED: endonuclease 8-like 1 [Gavialis gangeticus]|uniref:endonuclease 8-like 1 n=1 Tax=Gavialis gangeticus TaxID=94835 RepID=UPI00092FA10C|nr:PREDICTED: endonuclease 8-like 1 [Gavialis gangeticus]